MSGSRLQTIPDLRGSRQAELKSHANNLSREKGAMQDRHRRKERVDLRGEGLCIVCIGYEFRV